MYVLCVCTVSIHVYEHHNLLQESIKYFCIMTALLEYLIFCKFWIKIVLIMLCRLACICGLYTDSYITYVCIDYSRLFVELQPKRVS